MSQDNNTNSDDEKVKKICEAEGYNYDSPERINAMTLLDNGYEFEKPNSDEPSNEELIKYVRAIQHMFDEDEEGSEYIEAVINRLASLNEENKRLEALPKVGDDIYKAFDKGVNWSKYLKAQYPLDDEDLEDEITRLKRDNDTLTIDLENRDKSLNLELNVENQRLKEDYCESELERVGMVFEVEKVKTQNKQLTAKIENVTSIMTAAKSQLSTKVYIERMDNAYSILIDKEEQP